jgi:hypothetical protein
MITYSYEKVDINLEKIDKEIQAEPSITGFLGSSVDTVLTLYFSSELESSAKTMLDNIVVEHTPLDMDEHVTNIILNARQFGSDLILQFAKDNILMGITQTGKTATIAMYLHKLEHFLTTGSLYAAIGEIDNILADEDRQHLEPFVTNERLQAYKDEILQYLGL